MPALFCLGLHPALEAVKARMLDCEYLFAYLDDVYIVTHADIFGTFKAWLDILFVDMTVYDDEEQRDGVPRRSDDIIVWSGDDMDVKSRKETMNYIICQGLSIMEERALSLIHI